MDTSARWAFDIWDRWTYLILVREDPFGVVREHCVVLDEPLLGLFGSRLVFWTPWVEEPAGEGLDLAVLVGD